MTRKMTTSVNPRFHLLPCGGFMPISLPISVFLCFKMTLQTLSLENAVGRCLLELYCECKATGELWRATTCRHSLLSALGMRAAPVRGA